MEKETFVRNFRAAANAALNFARTFFLEPLPDAMRFRVCLNCSYDGNPLLPDEKIYPEDSTYERDLELHRCTNAEVVSALWREGAVPEWVDVSVVAQLGTVTVLQLLCCGRFTPNDYILYHQEAGLPPFHVVGPAVPEEYKDGDRFSIWHRSELWSRDDLEQSIPHVEKIWSLNLLGGAFDDSILSSLPVSPSMETLALNHSPSQGSGLTAQSKHPRLRVLRVSLANSEDFSIQQASRFPALKTLSVSNLPSGPCGLEKLLRNVPRLTSLTLESTGRIVFDGSISGNLRELRIAAKSLRGEIHLPREIDQLWLHLPESTPLEIDRLLHGVERVRALFLSRTPVDDACAEEIVSRLTLESIDLEGTKVSTDCAQRLMQQHPGLRVRPNLVRH